MLSARASLRRAALHATWEPKTPTGRACATIAQASARHTPARGPRRGAQLRAAAGVWGRLARTEHRPRRALAQALRDERRRFARVVGGAVHACLLAARKLVRARCGRASPG